MSESRGNAWQPREPGSVTSETRTTDAAGPHPSQQGRGVYSTGCEGLSGLDKLCHVLCGVRCAPRGKAARTGYALWRLGVCNELLMCHPRRRHPSSQV